MDHRSLRGKINDILNENIDDAPVVEAFFGGGRPADMPVHPFLNQLNQFRKLTGMTGGHVRHVIRDGRQGFGIVLSLPTKLHEMIEIGTTGVEQPDGSVYVVLRVGDIRPNTINLLPEQVMRSSFFIPIEGSSGAYFTPIFRVEGPSLGKAFEKFYQTMRIEIINAIAAHTTTRGRALNFDPHVHGQLATDFLATLNLAPHQIAELSRL